MAYRVHDALPDPSNEEILISINGDLILRANVKAPVFDRGFPVRDSERETLRLHGWCSSRGAGRTSNV